MSFDPNRPTTPPQFSPVPPEPSPGTGVGAVPTGQVPPAPVTAAPPAISVARKRAGVGLLNVILVLAALVATGGVAFAVGRSTAPAPSAAAGRGGFGGAGFPGGSFAPRASGAVGGAGGRGGFGGAGGAGAGLTVSGTVVSVADGTLTITTTAGQTITVATDPSTTYNTEATGSASDVQAGKTVQVQLSFAGGGQGRPGASPAAGTSAAPVGTAGSVTVVP